MTLNSMGMPMPSVRGINLLAGSLSRIFKAGGQDGR